MENLVVLPKFLNPNKVKNLIRLGKNNDGGYIVNAIDVINTKNLISLGISFDYSFEEDFLKMNNKTNVRTYDGSVGFKYYRKKCKHRIKNFLLKPNIKTFINVIEGLNLLLKFSIFFKFNLFRKIVHTEKFVTSDTSSFKDFEKGYGYQPKFIEFNNILSHKLNSVFLSIDIEGGEYELLEDICGFSKNLIGLNIEFHNVQDNLVKIKSFIKKFDLLLVHTHINNFGPIVNGIPSVIELSFSNNSEIDRFSNHKLTDKLPINLDQPNNLHGIDYLVTFK
jgi:hypothetical protein